MQFYLYKNIVKLKLLKRIAQADKMSTWAILEKRTLLFNQS